VSQLPLVQSAASAHSAHWPSSVQAGWSGVQSVRVKHARHWRVTAVQCGREPSQSVSIEHWPQTPKAVHVATLPL
jgi:hypothetical protein